MGGQPVLSWELSSPGGPGSLLRCRSSTCPTWASATLMSSLWGAENRGTLPIGLAPRRPPRGGLEVCNTEKGRGQVCAFPQPWRHLQGHRPRRPPDARRSGTSQSGGALIHLPREKPRVGFR